jgi:hypothetical protein
VKYVCCPVGVTDGLQAKIVATKLKIEFPPHDDDKDVFILDPLVMSLIANWLSEVANMWGKFK